MTAATPGTKADHNSARSAARLAAVQALYQLDMTPGADPGRLVAEFDTHRLGKSVEDVQFAAADRSFFHDLVTGVSARRGELDDQITAKLAKGWALDRLDRTLIAILRAGLYELAARPDIPTAVVINEYVDVAKAFHSDQDSGFVNGILDHLARDIRGGAA